MAAKFKRGTAVEQVMPKPYRGVVASFVLDEVTGDIIYVIKDEDGQMQTFREDDLKAVPVKDPVKK